MMRIARNFAIATVAICLAGNTSTAQSSGTMTDASVFFSAAARARSALKRDAGKLWGARLDSVEWIGVSGKTMLLSSAPNATGYTQSDGVWSGPLPTTITPSNTSVTWSGRTWAMILLPMPDDTLAAERLMIHEAMHVLQPSVLPAPSYDETGAGAALLDQASGRSSLRLEWRALAAALRAHGAARDSAVHDALLFRATRYAIASQDEIRREGALDVKEGIPEYTAWKLSNSPRAEFVESVDSAPATLQSFIRGFPYYTGPAYAMLLDDYTSGSWRKSLAAHPDLQSTIAKVIASRHVASDSIIRSALVSKPTASASATLASAARTRALFYDGPAIVAEENARWTARERQLAEYRSKFVEGPTVRLQPHSLNVSFNPRGQASLGESGTVMANLVWKSADGASLTAPSGALINQSWTELRVPLGNVHLEPGVVRQPTTVRGAGWTLVLVPGWAIRAEGSSMIVLPAR